MSDAAAVFNQHAGEYNATRRRLVPSFDSLYGTAVDAIALAGPNPRRILDLGAGTGLLAAGVRAVYPKAELTLLDGAAAMLERARASLGDDGATYVEADFADSPPPGPWDAVVSSLAIHHLEDDGKRALFARIHDELRPGGVFVNAEQVDGPSPLFTRLYEDWHEAHARGAGASDAEWAAAEERMLVDRCTDVESQLRWLREAGFSDVDCIWKDHRLAVIVARR
jgi:tRNA (cmo5U34)-methyltransferase